MSEPIKYCEDCKFYKPWKGDNRSLDGCGYLRAMTGIALVARGAHTDRNCVAERSHTDGDSCGPNAKWFEAKPESDAADDDTQYGEHA